MGQVTKIRKQMWNQARQEFVPVHLYRTDFDYYTTGQKYRQVQQWLQDNYGPSQQHDSDRYWGEIFNGIVMCEKVYLFYRIRWDGQT